MTIKRPEGAKMVPFIDYNENTTCPDIKGRH